MGRKRTIDRHLPKRLFLRRGAYYYVSQIGDGAVWQPLGRDEEAAVSRANELNSLRRADRLKLLGDVRSACDSLRDEVFGKFENRCIYCGSDRDLGIDHFIPFSNGGSTLRFNLVVACSSCNAKKGDGSPADFLLEIMGVRDQLLAHALTRFFGQK